MMFFRDGFDLDSYATEKEYFDAAYDLASIKKLIVEKGIEDYPKEEKERLLIRLGENVVIISSFTLNLSFNDSLVFAKYTQYFIETLISEKTKTITGLEKMFNKPM